MKTIGQNIVYYRKKKGLTQEKLAEICNVSPQAVSKWENDLSCPDISLLKLLAHTLEITVDGLLDDGESSRVGLAPLEKGKILKIRVIDKTDKITINLPIALIEVLLKNGFNERIFKGEKKQRLSSIDFEQVLQLVSLGVIGKILELQSDEGELIEVWVE